MLNANTTRRWDGSIMAARRHAGAFHRRFGIMVFFNDPVPMERPAEAAVRMAMEMQQAFVALGLEWQKRGFELGLGCGVAQGYATLGQIGFEGRRDYAAIGSVTNLAARLCAEARSGQVLVDRKTMARIETLVRAAPLGALTLKGFTQPVPAFVVEALQVAA